MQISLESDLGTLLFEIDKSAQLVCTRYRIAFDKYKAIGYNIFCVWQVWRRCTSCLLSDKRDPRKRLGYQEGSKMELSVMNETEKNHSELDELVCETPGTR